MEVMTVANFHEFYEVDDGLELFFRGMKPAIWVDEATIVGDMRELYNYPNCRFAGKGSGGDRLRLFFNDEDLLGQFEYRREMYEAGEICFDRLLGYTLGYPPCAIETYISGDYVQEDKVVVSFYGMHFMSYKHVLYETLDWLHEHYGVGDMDGVVALLYLADDDVVLL